ncbi:MAG: Ig-like domain-containing protein, partial [Lachnospiraceae bacterium]|nr:Ig-like domain-containing protein [Lachnospiraceae bacterium]
VTEEETEAVTEEETEAVTVEETEAVTEEETEAEEEAETEVEMEMTAAAATEEAAADTVEETEETGETTSYVAYIGDNGYDSLAAAVAAANAATEAVTIQLRSSVALDTSVVISNSYAVVTLDLNGYAIIRGSSNTTFYLVGVVSGSSLNITDSSVDQTGMIYSSNYTVASTGEDGTETTTTYGGYGILTNGTVTVESGTVSGYYGIYVSGIDTSASLTVKGGTVSGGLYGVYVYDGGGSASLTMNGGTVSGYCGASVSGEDASLTVNSGTVSGTNRGVNVNSGAVTIAGGTVTGTTYGLYQSNGSVTVTGGTVGSESTKYGFIQSAGTVEITGGTVSGSDRAIQIASGTATISGGEVSGSSYGLMVFGGDVTMSGGTASGYYAGAYVTGTTANLTVSGSAVVKSTATVSEDAVLESTDPYYSTSAISVYKGATVTVESGTVTGGYVGISPWGGDTENTTTVTVNGGTISGTAFGISTNGSASESYWCGNNTITVNGGTITGGGTGMYLPAVDSTTTINGGTITGNSTGIEIRAGELTVTGGTITGEATSSSVSPNGSGTTEIGAGIAVSQHTTNQKITVTITGGTISGYYGVCETNTVEGNTSEVNVTISGGSTKISTTDTTDGAAVYSTSLDKDWETKAKNDTTVTITGGTYNTDVGEYLENSDGDDKDEDTYVLLSNGDGTYTAMTESKAEEKAPVYVTYTYKDENGDEQTYTIYYDGVSDASGVIDATVTGYSGTYDGKAHSISVVVNSPSDTAITYSTDGESYSSSLPSYTNVGTYTVYYKIVTSDGETTLAGHETVSITKAAQSISYVTTSVTKTYGDAAFTNTLTKTTVAGTISYASSNTSVATVDTNGKVTIKGVGTTTITATAAATANYTAATASYKLTVATASQSISYATTSVTKTYGDAAFTNTLTKTTVVGTITYSSSDTSVAKVSSKGKVTIKGVGTATITAKAAATANYKAATATYTLTVKDAVTSAEKKAAKIKLNQKIQATWSGSKIKVTWGKVSNADGYEVYFSQCGKTLKKVKTVKSGSTTSYTISKLSGKKLNLTYDYKVQVKAYRYVNGKKTYLATSYALHTAGSKTKYTNPTKVKFAKSSTTVKVGKTTTVKVTVTKANKNRALLGTDHCAKVRYFSTDTSVAKVSSSGKITGVKKGTCTIYALAVNGVKAKLKVTVK